MSRPDDIPQDVWESARDVAFDFDCDWTADGRRRGEHEYDEATKAIARAILAERERCERIAQAEIDRTRRRMAETPDEPRMLVNQAWGMCGDTAAIILDAIRKGGE